MILKYFLSDSVILYSLAIFLLKNGVNKYFIFSETDMAKWGEGDPRWIVEERPDATNVNNWHWTEKNADAWSKAKIRVR